MKKLFCLIFAIIFLSGNANLWATAIDVGPAAVNRASRVTLKNYTIIATENPANGTGTIDHIEIYMNTAVSSVVDVAAFEEVRTDGFTSRGSSGDLNVVINLNTFDAPGDFTAFDINAGDYIGSYGDVSGTDTRIDRTNSGSGQWAVMADRIPCTNASFTFTAAKTISLYASGITAAPPPAVGVQSHILMLD